MKDILILLLALTGCVETEIPEVKTGTASKSAEYSVSIVNDAVNTTLHIEGCSLSDMESAVLEYGDTIEFTNIVHPKDTIVLDGNLWSGEFLIYKGMMYTPFSRMVRTLELNDSLGNRLLHPIGFDAGVNDWE